MIDYNVWFVTKETNFEGNWKQSPECGYTITYDWYFYDCDSDDIILDYDVDGPIRRSADPSETIESDHGIIYVSTDEIEYALDTI